MKNSKLNSLTNYQYYFYLFFINQSLRYVNFLGNSCINDLHNEMDSFLFSSTTKKTISIWCKENIKRILMDCEIFYWNSVFDNWKTMTDWTVKVHHESLNIRKPLITIFFLGVFSRWPLGIVEKKKNIFISLVSNQSG